MNIGQKKKSSIKEFGYNDINPYIPAVVEHISEKRYRKASGIKWEQVLNEDTGELEKRQNLILGQQKKVDQQEWYKVYNGTIKKFYGLNPATMEVFEYVMKNIQYSSDRICIPPSDVITQTGMGVSTYYRSIVQLLNAQIIAKAEKEGCYYINPAIAFKGDRITIVEQYIRENKERENQYTRLPATAKRDVMTEQIGKYTIEYEWQVEIREGTIKLTEYDKQIILADIEVHGITSGVVEWGEEEIATWSIKP